MKPKRVELIALVGAVVRALAALAAGATDPQDKVHLASPAMIKACLDGVPADG